eukprot:Tbor_TRINITY_DN6230_c1_g1::TRINITY_DN6230_c1_g1_i2::g.1708::m.1708
MTTLPPDPLAHITVSNDEVTFQTSGIAVKCGHLFFQTQEKEFTGIMIARQVLFQLSREIGINGADTYLETLDDSTRPKSELYIYAAKLASAFGGANIMEIHFQIVLTEIIRNLAVQSAPAQPPTILEPQLPMTDPYLPTTAPSVSPSPYVPNIPNQGTIQYGNLPSSQQLYSLSQNRYAKIANEAAAFYIATNPNRYIFRSTDEDIMNDSTRPKSELYVYAKLN